MKIGIDLHGVLDQKPKFWVDFAKQIKAAKGEIHIISGQSWCEKLKSQLLEYNNGQQWWDFYFSIDDNLRHEKKIDYCIDEKSGRRYPSEIWDSAKGEYCLRNQIDIMFDDSSKYGQYFKTPYFKIE